MTGSTNPGITLSYVLILSLWLSSQWILIPYVVHILVLVTAILYVACHSSLILLEEPSEEDKANGVVSNSSTETLRTEDAYQFPLVGSLSLGSLYLAFKFLNKEWVNFIIGFYFVAVGCFATFATASSIVPRYGTPRIFQRTIRHPIPAFLLESPLQLDFSVTISDIFLFLASMILCGFYAYTKHWTMNNILGICFCLQGIERFSLGTYKIGAILLIGLFFYDIFWVFGTDVMVTVAKNLDGPIKILFPRGRNSDTGKLELSLLGLGDIVIPGFFLALLLRFDATRGGIPKTKPLHWKSAFSFPKPYFHSALVAYVAGLATTLYVMIVFQAAQPALLYLVPACLGSSALCAVIRGEWNDLLAYSEEKEEINQDPKVDASSKPLKED